MQPPDTFREIGRRRILAYLDSRQRV